MDTIFDNINEYLISRDYVKKEDVNGCSEEEIQFLEEKINGHFPQSFRTFLKTLGKLNTDIFYSDDYKIGFKSFEEVHNDFRERLRRFELEVLGILLYYSLTITIRLISLNYQLNQTIHPYSLFEKMVIWN